MYNRFIHIEKMLETTDFWDKVPKLKALRAKVEAEPKIAAWIADRPKGRP